MVVRRVTRIANPRRRVAARTRPRKANARKRLSAKQIKFFGTKAQRAALKRRKVKANPKRRRSVAKTAPRRRSVVRMTKAAPRRRRRRKTNPAHILTLGLAGLVNPRPRKKRRNTKVAATRKRRRKSTAKTAPRRRRRVARMNPRRRRRRNTTVVVRTRRRRRSSNPRRTRRVSVRRYSRGRRRNPSLFGHGGGMEMGKMVIGGLAGVTICKAVPNMLPASLTSTPIMRTVTSIAIAVGSGFLAGKFIGDKTVADAIMFGGLMQAGSVALNSFLPSVGATIGLQGLGGGMGDLIAGSYPIPQNPIFPQFNPGYGALPAPAMAQGAGKSNAPALSGLAGPFGSAF